MIATHNGFTYVLYIIERTSDCIINRRLYNCKTGVAVEPPKDRIDYKRMNNDRISHRLYNYRMYGATVESPADSIIIECMSEPEFRLRPPPV